MSKITTYNCKRCGATFMRERTSTTDTCGICELHLETGVIGYGLKPALPGFVPPKKRR